MLISLVYFVYIGWVIKFALSHIIQRQISPNSVLIFVNWTAMLFAQSCILYNAFDNLPTWGVGHANKVVCCVMAIFGEQREQHHEL